MKLRSKPSHHELPAELPAGLMVVLPENYS